MSSFPVTWVLVADSGRSRLFTWASADGDLTEIDDRINPQARLREADLVSDRPGGSVTHAGKSPHPLRGAHSAKHQQSGEFADEIAHELKRSLDNHQFERLVLVCPPEFLGVLRAKLDHAVSMLVAEVIGLDLTKASPIDIKARLPTLHP